MQNSHPSPITDPQVSVADDQKTPNSADEFVVSMSEPNANHLKAATQMTSESESLEDQNIFTLLGVENGSEQQKESFLDELQQVIWEDFLDYDVKLLVTKEEQDRVNQLLAQPGADTEKHQEEVVVFLEKLIPDLESIMLEKALELKAEMVRERIISMKDLYSTDQGKLERVSEAEDLLNQDKWRSAAGVLNAV